jgi:hypothetical protein
MQITAASLLEGGSPSLAVELNQLRGEEGVDISCLSHLAERVAVALDGEHDCQRSAASTRLD